MYQEKENIFEKKPSEAIYHTHQHTAKKMTGLEQKTEDTTKEKNMREIFHMENALLLLLIEKSIGMVRLLPEKRKY